MSKLPSFGSRESNKKLVYLDQLKKILWNFPVTAKTNLTQQSLKPTTKCIHVHISITQVQVCLQGFHHRPGKKQFLAALSMTFPAWFDHLLESLHEKFSSNSFAHLWKPVPLLVKTLMKPLRVWQRYKIWEPGQLHVTLTLKKQTNKILLFL